MTGSKSSTASTFEDVRNDLVAVGHGSAGVRRSGRNLNSGRVVGTHLFDEAERSGEEEGLRYLYQVTPPPDWAAGAALCREIPAFTELEDEEQSSMCVLCPMQAICHEYAVTNNEYGIWAGLNQEQRLAGDDMPTKVTQPLENAQASMTSSVKGVSWSAREGRWSVNVRESGKRAFGGYHTQLEKAEHAAIELRATMKGEAMHNTTGQIKVTSLYGTETTEWVELGHVEEGALNIAADATEEEDIDVIDEKLQERFEKLCSPVIIIRTATNGASA